MEKQRELIATYTNHFLNGKQFSNIVEARAEAATILEQPVRPGSDLAKLVDESLERGLVRAAQTIVHSGKAVPEIYEFLVDLYSRQPNLSTRSSTSVAQQAYSTPIPIAYLATKLAKISSHTTIYEPTAGNGCLLLGTEASKVLANELNPERAADLRAQRYVVTEQDATTYLPSQQVDVVILNPPFASVRAKDGSKKVFEVPNAGSKQGQSFVTTQIDQAIALNSLKALKDDGRAVLILAGKMGTESERSNSYNSQQTRAFYYTLYNLYNVTSHISIDGNLYSRQGAKFPIHALLIEGRGKSKLTLPAASVPRIYHTFNELKELLPNAVPEYHKSVDTNLNRTNDGCIGSGFSTTEPERNIELQRLSGAISHADRVDDPTRREPDRSAENNRALSGFRGNVLPGISPVKGGRIATGMGDRSYPRKPIFPGETELRSGGELPGTDSGQPGRLGDDRADLLGRMAATDGSRTQGRVDVEHFMLDQNSTSTREGEMVTNNLSDDHLPSITEQPRQIPYIPFSNARPAETLVPANMQSGMATALSRLQQQVGSIDEYVSKRLNYESPGDLHQHLNAEQVDAVALTISNLEKGRGFIIGDQTGVGKGRVVASAIRYAGETGRIPIFVTKDPVLYPDIIRDLSDIGISSFKPFVTNADLNISLPDGRQLKTSPTNHKREMQALLKSGVLENMMRSSLPIAEWH